MRPTFCVPFILVLWELFFVRPPFCLIVNFSVVGTVFRATNVPCNIFFYLCGNCFCATNVSFNIYFIYVGTVFCATNILCTGWVARGLTVGTKSRSSFVIFR